ncbi:MAG TPA: DNA-binding protein [Anaerolineae bacterium]|nr:DNA-binding protein [Anaerolineae bacterium]
MDILDESLEILTAEECAELLRVSMPTMYSMLSEKREPGKIFGRRVGREWRILRSEVIRFLSEEPIPSEPTPTPVEALA